MWNVQIDPETRDHIKREWNSRVKSIRRAELMMGIAMIVLGAVCIFYPRQSIYVLELLASFAILAFGIFKIAEYFSVPVYLRMPGLMVSGILDILISIMLMTSPSGVLLETFAWIMAIDLMVMGIEELSYSSVLKWISVESYDWVVVNGVLNIIISLLLFILPASSSVAILFLLAIYLIVGGVSLLIEYKKSKDLKIKDDDDIIDA